MAVDPELLEILVCPKGVRLTGIDHIPRDVNHILRIQVIQESLDDVRILSSAPDTLYDLVADGSFDAGLYYRLNAVYVPIPPLRERPADVEPLLQYFIWLAATRQGMASPGLRPEWRAFYDGYAWPGNVRESQDVAETIVAQCAVRDIPRNRVH